MTQPTHVKKCPCSICTSHHRRSVERLLMAFYFSFGLAMVLALLI